MRKNPSENLHAHPEFMKKLKKLQGQMMAVTGEKPPSLTKITKDLATCPEFEEIEKKIIKGLSKKEFRMRFN